MPPLLPTPKMERWKYTDLAPAVRDMPQEASAPRIHVQNGENLVHEIGGAFPVEMPGMPLWNPAAFGALGGVAIDVPAGKRVDIPVNISIEGVDNTFFIPRVVVRLGEGAALTVVERHNGTGRYWNNQLTKIEIGAGAILRHVRIQENPAQAVYTQNTHVAVDRNGRYESFTLTTGSLLSRNEVQVDLSGEGASCNLSGANLLDGRQHGDTTLTVVHSAPGCRSEQFYRSLLRGQGRGVFQGRIRVNKGADHTDATQLSNAILLSEGAEMDTKPELEIYADDVKCSHGATAGALDEEALFYMRSRGLREEEARAVLLSAFVNEVIEKFECNAAEEIIKEKIKIWLGN